MGVLGKRGTDRVTGFEGIIMAECTYLYGSNRYGLSGGLDKDGDLREVEWFDVERVEILD